MVLNLKDKEGNKSGKGLNWSLFGLLDGEHESKNAKVFKRIVADMNAGTVAGEALEKELTNLTTTGKKLGHEIVDAGGGVEEISQGFLTAANSLNKTTISAKAATLGMKVLSVATNMGAMLAISAAISLIVKGLDKLIVTSAEAIEAGKEAAETIKSVNDAFKTNSEYVSSNTAEYAKLSQGVGKFNENLKLSEEDYKTYLEQNSKLAEIFPELIVGFDAEGNAVLNLDGSVRNITDTLNEYLAVAKQTANQKVLAEFGDTLAGSTAQIGAYKEELKKLKKEGENLQNTATYQGVEIPIVAYENDDGNTAYKPKTDFANINDAANLQNKLRGMDINSELQRTLAPSGELLWSVDFKIDETLLDYSIDNASQVIETKMAELEHKIRQEKLTLSPATQAYLDTSLIYGQFSKDTQNAISSIVSNLDFTGKSEEQVKSIIDDIVVKFNSNDAIKTAASNLFKLDKSKMPYGEWQQAANDLINTLADALGLTGDKRNEFIINLGFKTDGLDPTIKAVDEAMPKVSAQEIESLTEDDINIAYGLKNIGNMTFEELQKSIEKTKEVAASTENIMSSLSDALAGMADKQSLLKSSTEEFAKANKLSLETVSNLAAQYPQLDRVLAEYISGARSGASVIDELNTAYENDVRIYKQSVLDKMQYSEEFYTSVVDGNSLLIDTFSENYGVDIENCKTYAQTKLAIEMALLGDLKDNWSKYYNAQLGTWNIEEYSKLGMAAVTSPEAARQVELYEKYKQALDDLNAITFTGISSEFGGLSDSAASAADKIPEAFQKPYAEIQYQRDKGIISEKEYLDKLYLLNEQYNQSNLENWQKYDLEITNGKKQLFEKQMKAQGEAYSKAIDKRIKELNKQKEAETEYYDSKIKELNDEKQALQEQYTEEDKLLQLELKRQAIEKAKSQKNVSIYRDGEFVWESDSDVVDDAEREMSDAQRDYDRYQIEQDLNKQIAAYEDAKQAAIDSIESQIEDWELLKESVQEQLSEIGLSMDEHNEDMALMAEAEKMSYAEMSQAITDYVNHYIEEMERMKQASKSSGKGSGKGSGGRVSDDGGAYTDTPNYASGRIGGKAEYAIVDEYKQRELIARTMGGRVTKLEYGDSVFPAHLSKEIFASLFGDSFKHAQMSQITPIERPVIPNVVSNNNSAQSISMGNVIINNPVGDVDSLARDITMNLPNKVLQTVFRR